MIASLASTGLARVTVTSPQRRVDVALPDGVPLAEILPELLSHAGDGLADDGERHGGWALRRADGRPLRPAASLGAQGVRDGEVLHLVAARADWPELEYDDVVEAIAAGARRQGAPWSAPATRFCGVAAAGVALAIGLAAGLRAGPPWPETALLALATALLLLVCGVLAARVYGSAAVGAALAGYALPYAFAGGLLVFAGSGAPVGLGAAQLLVGSVALLLASLLGAVGVGSALRVFVAGVSAGVLGTAGALIGLASGWFPPGAGVAGPTAAVGGPATAAVVLTLVVTGAAGVPLIAIRLGRLPMPQLGPSTGPAPRDPAGPAQPDRAVVFAAVARTDEILTGMLLGIAVSGAAASVVLAFAGGPAGRLLVAVAAVAFLLRARLFVTVRQRLPLLGLGLSGIAALASAAAGSVRPGGSGAALWVLLVAAALLVAVAGARYATRAPSPYLGRAADLLDALCVVSVLPVACAVLGLYDLMRNLIA